MKKPTKAQLKKWASDQGFKSGDCVMASPDGVEWRLREYYEHDGMNHVFVYRSDLMVVSKYTRPLTASERKDLIKRIRWEGEV